MQLTGREREVVIAFCQKMARECRDRASRISFPDLRESAEQTARMWDEIAASVLVPAHHDSLNPRPRNKPDPDDKSAGG